MFEDQHPDENDNPKNSTENKPEQETLPPPLEPERINFKADKDKEDKQ